MGLLLAAADPCVRAPLRPRAAGEPAPPTRRCVEEKVAPIAPTAEALSPPPLPGETLREETGSDPPVRDGALSPPPLLPVEAQELEQPTAGPAPVDRAALELRAAEAQAGRARQRRQEEERQPPPEQGVEAEAPPPAEPPENPTLGPTGALFLSGAQGLSGASPQATLYSVGGRLGVRYMPESAPLTALSLVGELSTSLVISEVGLVARAELMHRVTGKMVPALRLGAFFQPLVRFDSASASAGIRGGLVLGWCIPAAGADAEASKAGGAVLWVASGFRELGLLVLAAAALVATPELTLSYEAVQTGFGMASGPRLSVGVGF